MEILFEIIHTSLFNYIFIFALSILFIFYKYKQNKKKIKEAKEILKQEKNFEKITDRFYKIENKLTVRIKKKDKFFIDCYTKYYPKQSLWKNLDEYIQISENFKTNDRQEIFEIYNLDTDFWQRKFIEEEKKKHKAFFDKVESHPLTERQREACLIMEKNNLILAGAGTGKTSIMVGRAGYLIKCKGVKPSDILMITFSKTGVNEMKNRASDKLGKTIANNIKIKTFHAFCNEISSEQKEPINLIQEEEKEKFVLQKLSDYHDDVIEYMDNHLYEEKTENDFRDKEAYFAYRKNEEIKTYRNETVKSHSERRIANWFSQNGIKYEYETEFVDNNGEKITRNGKTIRYYPDFYLPDYNIWIEFFGLDLEGKTREDINEIKYKADMEWKKEIHEKYESKFIDLYFADVQNGTLFETLEQHLSDFDVELDVQTSSEVWSLMEQSYLFSDVTKLVNSMIDFVKVKIYRDIDSIDELKSLEGMDFFKNIFDDYQEMLKEEGKIDFVDMILNGIKAIETGKYKKNYEHILVDEFQDTSDIQADLIKLIRDKNGESVLCCVGDDWQSIYRWQGGNVSLITQFANNFGDTSIVKLDKAFRFNKNILNVANNFIMQNPLQLKKEIGTDRDIEDNSIVLMTHDIPEYGSNKNYILSNHLGSIIKTIRKNDNHGKIMILTRNNRPFDGREFTKYCIKNKCEMRTIHSSKGLEAEYVIVLGVDNAWYGIPSKKEDAKELRSLIPNECEGIDYADERRLFYVALTRAKKKIYLISDPRNQSEYIDELLLEEYDHYLNKDKFELLDKNPCPSCGATRIREKGKRNMPDYWKCIEKDCIEPLEGIK